MPLSLLDSQFAALQEPAPDEHPIVVDGGGRPPEIVAEIVSELEARQGNDGPHGTASQTANAMAASPRDRP
jgi:hypothetical protein